MEGVTILAQETFLDFSVWGCLSVALIGLILGLCVITATSDMLDNNASFVLMLICVIVASTGLGVLAGYIGAPEVKQYKVSVFEDVPFVEFYEKYEIIDQQGLIFTVREKDQN